MKSLGETTLRCTMEKKISINGDLVEPGGVHGGVDHDRVGVAGCEAVDGGLASVGGAVVNDPEHPAC